MTNPAPVYVGMPPTDRVLDVHWRAAGQSHTGRIRCGGPCKDDYARIKHYTGPGGQTITLQQAALDSLRDAEKALRYAIVCTGTWRSCAYQASLYASDPNRYANPNTTAHTRGLAIDVSQAQSKTKLAAIHRALLARGWHQARPTGSASPEPWHYSMGIQV